MALNKMQIEEVGFSQRPIAFTYSDDEQVSVIRKDLVDLTGNHFSAVILNQLLYWTLRVKDLDLFLEEERTQGDNIGMHDIHRNCGSSSRHGWIYKTANDLIDETLLGISHPTMRKYLKLLIDQGWVEERAHPLDKWNKTTQYRINLRKLKGDLMAMGRNLPTAYLKAFASSLKEENLNKYQKTELLNGEESTPKNIKVDENQASLKSNVKNLPLNGNPSESSFPLHPSKEEILNVRNLQSSAENFSSDVRSFHSDVKSLHSNVKNLHSYPYTENTTETTNKEHTQSAREDFSIAEAMVALWEQHISQKLAPIHLKAGNMRGVLHLTEERKSQLEFLFAFYFQNDIRLWEQFCLRIKASPFLMGEGKRKWRVSLDWILNDGNLLKVLEGNFDDPETLNQQKEEVTSANRERERAALLAAIEDPLWKEWCSQLNFDIQSPDAISLGELKDISNAKFLEVEDGKLVWIGSSNKNTLSHIENLRLKIFPIIARTFPNTRTLRTRLCEEVVLSPSEEAGATPFHFSNNQLSTGGENYVE